MSIQKASWFNSEKKVNISFPFAKVDKEKRTVSGFATLDNVDRHGDIVTADASEKAFARFRGNLREMHQPIAVGKVVSFKPQDFFDKETGQHFKGVYVDAYISKGAEDTWTKVLDGTLTGFSIGGNIVEASYEPGDDKEDNRIIKDYELMELSLVDNPANPLANIFSIQKNGDSFMFKGMATEIDIENIFWCGTDQIATTANADSINCSICTEKMTSIGWVESSDTEKSYAIEKAVDSYLRKDDAPGPTHAATTHDAEGGAVTSEQTINLYPEQNKIKKSSIKVGSFVTWSSSGGKAYGKVKSIKTSGTVNVPGSSVKLKADADNPIALITVYKKTEKGFVPTDVTVGHKVETLNVSVKKSDTVNKNFNSEGGNEEMAEETTNEVVEEATQVDEVVEEVAGIEEAVEETTEEASTVSEVPVEDLDFTKMIDTLKSDITETIEKNYATQTAAADQAVQLVKETSETIEKSITDFGTKQTELTGHIADIFTKIADLEKRMDAYEASTAVKKSADDMEKSADSKTIQKSIWAGHFLGVENL